MTRTWRPFALFLAWLALCGQSCPSGKEDPNFGPMDRPFAGSLRNAIKMPPAGQERPPRNDTVVPPHNTGEIPRPTGLPVDLPAGSFNAKVLQALQQLRGGFNLRANLNGAVTVQGDNLVLNPAGVTQANCATATYMAFLMALHAATNRPVPAVFRASGSDGQGIWGRWNANGPGTACLIKELGAGSTIFANDAAGYAQAQPGDQVKVMWKVGAGTPIGQNESGHATILISQDDQAMKLWGAHQGTGVGELVVPKNGTAGSNGKIMGAAFITKITDPQAVLTNAARVGGSTNSFLAALLRTHHADGLAAARQNCGN